MTAEATAPVVTETAPVITEAPPIERPVNAVKALVGRYEARLRDEAGKFAPAEDEPPKVEGEPAKPAEAKADEKPKVDDKPAEKPPEKQQVSHLQLAKLQSDLKRTSAELLTHKGKAEALEAELTPLKQRVAAFEKEFEDNPVKAWEKYTKKTFKELIDNASTGKYNTGPELPPEVSAKISELEKFKVEYEKQKADSEAKAKADAEEAEKVEARKEDHAFTTEFLTEHKAKFPLYSAAEWAADDMVDRAYAKLQAGEKVDFEAIAADCEKRAEKNLTTLFTNEQILSSLAKSDVVRQALVKAFSLTEQPKQAAPASGQKGTTSQEKGLRTLSQSVTQEAPPAVPSPASEDTEEDWLAGAKARWAAQRNRSAVTG